MNIITKAVFSMLYILSIPAVASTSSTSLYEKIYGLAEKMYYLEYSLSDEQRKMTADLANQIEAVINEPNSVTCGDKLKVYQDAYKWSYSSTGFNDTSSEAEKSATLIASKFCPAAYFEVIKASHEFAYSSTGMNKTRSEAKKFAFIVSDFEASRFYSKNSLKCYSDSYLYAYSSSGMNKTRSESEKFANKMCLDESGVN